MNERNIRLKRPGICVVCGGRIPAAHVVINPAVDACSDRCRRTIGAMSLEQRRQLVIDNFVDGPDIREVIEMYTREIEMRNGMNQMMQDIAAKIMGSEPTEDYMRPMGVEQPEPKPVFKPMKPSASIFIAGETDEEIAQHVLMVCWGKVAK